MGTQVGSAKRGDICVPARKCWCSRRRVGEGRGFRRVQVLETGAIPFDHRGQLALLSILASAVLSVEIFSPYHRCYEALIDRLHAIVIPSYSLHLPAIRQCRDYAAISR